MLLRITQHISMEWFHHPMTFFLVLVTCSFFFLSKAIDCGGKHISNTITVNPNGKKAFKTIQDAINSVKNNNDKWVKIHIKAGLYM